MPAIARGDIEISRAGVEPTGWRRLVTMASVRAAAVTVLFALCPCVGHAQAREAIEPSAAPPAPRPTGYTITEQDLLSGARAFFGRRNHALEAELRLLTLDHSPTKLEWRVAYLLPDPVIFRCWVNPKQVRSAADFRGTNCRRVHLTKGAQNKIETIERRTRQGSN